MEIKELIKVLRFQSDMLNEVKKHGDLLTRSINLGRRRQIAEILDLIDGKDKDIK